MKKWKQKNVAGFLAICMILSLFTGMPVNASQEDGLDEEPPEIVNENGLKVTVGLDFVDIIDETTGESTGKQELLTTEEGSVVIPAYKNDDGVLVKHEYAEWERWTSFYGEDLWLDYVTEDGITTHVTYANITVTSPSGNDVTEEVASQHEIDDRVIRFQPTEAGRYTITYNLATAEVSDNSLTINVGCPEVGFYTYPKANAENLLKDDLFEYSDINKTFYTILQCDGSTIALSEEAPFKIKDWDVNPDPDTYITDETEIADYIKYEAVEEETGIYKVTVNTNKYFGLVVTATVEEDQENPTRDRWISVEPKMEGLVLKDQIDWDEDTGTPSVNLEAEFAKETYPELYGTTLYFAYVEKEGAEGELITADNEYISVSYDGKPAGKDLVEYGTNENNPDLIDFTFYEVGDYTVTYAIGDICSSVVIHVGYPVAAFYTTEEMSAEGFLRDGEFPYNNENRTVYFIVNDNPDKTITDTEISINDWNEEDIAIETIEENKKYKITVKDDVRASFGLTAQYYCKWDWEKVPKEDRRDIYMYTDEGAIYTDGIAHLGYAGCYISEYEFETCNGINYNSGNSQYWVHADTIQGVIDKLAAVSEGEEVLFNPDDPDDTATGIVNTGYIHINVSHFGDIQLEPQYISSSGNMKGIQFEAGNDHYFTIPDENHSLTEDGIYIEDKLYIVTKEGKVEFPALADVDIISRYCDELYTVVKHTEDGKLYYSLGEKIDIRLDSKSENTIPEADNQKMALGELLDSLEYNDAFTKYFDVYWMPAFQFPELHVNMYSDMKFAGNMSELYIGFKDGENNKASIFSRTENGLERVTTYSKDDINKDSETIDVVYDDIYAEGGTGYSVSNVKVHLYEIASTSQSDESSTYVTEAGDKVTLAVAPEPYSLKELKSEQIKAIEIGEKLTVSIKADEIDQATATDSEKNAIEEICKTVEMNLGKTAVVGAFLDLSVSAKVDTVEEETKITETKAPMTVTVPLTKELQGRKNYAIVRYHEGIGGHVDVLTAKLLEDGKTLSFDTDRFSVYAIVYEKEDLDLSKVAWNYKDAFTYDGSAKTVELTGLPKGLTATYTGNTATEPGTYTAQVTFSYDDTVYNAPDVSMFSSLQWQIVKTETPAASTAPTAPADTTKAGDTATVDGNNYTVTSVADNQKTVTYVSGDKKATNVTVPDTVTISGTTYQVTAIADNAFKNCTALKKVTIPKNVTTIGKNAFYGCKKLTTVKYSGTAVTKIDQGAFRKCTSLKSVTIPKSVTEIGKDAFRDCTKLSKITFKGTAIKKIGKNAFKNIAKKPTIKVPAKKKTAYKKLLKSAGYTKTVK
ncbi:MAG: leucine-rich repeat domain-containing protein [Lachnospiraceae bacterium]